LTIWEWIKPIATAILPTAIREQLVVGADGALEPLTAVSPRPVALTVRHAGIVRVKRWAFSMA